MKATPEALSLSRIKHVFFKMTQVVVMGYEDYAGVGSGGTGDVGYHVVGRMFNPFGKTYGNLWRLRKTAGPLREWVAWQRCVI